MSEEWKSKRSCRNCYYWNGDGVREKVATCFLHHSKTYVSNLCVHHLMQVVRDEVSEQEEKQPEIWDGQSPISYEDAPYTWTKWEDVRDWIRDQVTTYNECRDIDYQTSCVVWATNRQWMQVNEHILPKRPDTVQEYFWDHADGWSGADDMPNDYIFKPSERLVKAYEEFRAAWRAERTGIYGGYGVQVELSEAHLTELQKIDEEMEES